MEISAEALSLAEKIGVDVGSIGANGGTREGETGNPDHTSPASEPDTLPKSGVPQKDPRWKDPDFRSLNQPEKDRRYAAERENKELRERLEKLERGQSETPANESETDKNLRLINEAGLGEDWNNLVRQHAAYAKEHGEDEADAAYGKDFKSVVNSAKLDARAREIDGKMKSFDEKTSDRDAMTAFERVLEKENFADAHLENAVKEILLDLGIDIGKPSTYKHIDKSKYANYVRNAKAQAIPLLAELGLSGKNKKLPAFENGQSGSRNSSIDLGDTPNSPEQKKEFDKRAVNEINRLMNL
jgi:hypothetical protein